MLKFSEIFEISMENFYFERIRMVRMVRMVRSLADRTFQLWPRRRRGAAAPPARRRGRRPRRERKIELVDRGVAQNVIDF